MQAFAKLPGEMTDAIPIRRPAIRLSPADSASGPTGASIAGVVVGGAEAPVAGAGPAAATGPAPIPRIWHASGPFATHVFDALSSTFPFGEAFFVRSVLHYCDGERDAIRDPGLRQRIRGFAGQEGQHSRVHDEHMTLLLAHGYRFLARRNRFLDRMLRFHNRRTPRFSLALTAALEHLTAILARRLLADSARLTADMHPAMAPVWRWHALEEAEHKSVAYDVLCAVAPGRGLRAIAMGVNTFFLCLETFGRTVYMLGCDGLLFDRGVWREGIRFLLGDSGVLRGLGPEYRAWYRRDFHPDQVDDTALIAYFAPRVAREIAG